MNALWSYFWPVLGAGLALGVIAGAIAFRLPRLRSKDKLAGDQLALHEWRRKRLLSLAIGALLCVAAAALWHGPLGAAGHFATKVERDARQTLVNYEMTRVTARLHHGPLTRRIMLSGPADDFQSSELVRIIGSIPGVSSARWSSTSGGIPLIAEGVAVSLLGFLLGLLLAYFVELRRRYNAQWNW